MFSFSREDVDRQQMQAEANLHTVYGFLLALDHEGLEAIKMIFTGFSNAEEKAAKVATFYAGIVETLLQERHGLCLACGKHHDDDLAQLVKEEPE